MRLAIALVATFLGLAWFALSMTRHWRQVVPDGDPPPAVQARLRLAGATMLVASLALCLSNDYWTMASLVWVMLLAVSAVLVAMLFAWRPRWLAPLIGPRRRT